MRTVRKDVAKAGDYALIGEGHDRKKAENGKLKGGKDLAREGKPGETDAQDTVYQLRRGASGRLRGTGESQEGGGGGLRTTGCSKRSDQKERSLKKSPTGRSKKYSVGESGVVKTRKEKRLRKAEITPAWRAVKKESASLGAAWESMRERRNMERMKGYHGGLRRGRSSSQ